MAVYGIRPRSLRHFWTQLLTVGMAGPLPHCGASEIAFSVALEPDTTHNPPYTALHTEKCAHVLRMLLRMRSWKISPTHFHVRIYVYVITGGAPEFYTTLRSKPPQFSDCSKRECFLEIMFVIGVLTAALVLHLSSQLPGSDAAFSGSVRCPCATSLGESSWQFSLEQAMLVSDVVMMGRVVELQEGLGGMMNASIASMITYKGRFSSGGGFLTLVENVTNFEKGAPRDMAIFFFAKEPAGNLALQCMAPLIALSAIGDLKAVLDYVRDLGRRKSFLCSC